MEPLALPYKIDLPLPELTREKNYRKKVNEITLAADYIEIRHHFYSEVQNEETGIWEDNLSFSIQKIQKSRVALIEFRYYQKGDLFGIDIDCEGVANKVSIYFTDKKEGQKVFGIIDKWIYS